MFKDLLRITLNYLNALAYQIHLTPKVLSSYSRNVDPVHSHQLIEDWSVYLIVASFDKVSCSKCGLSVVGFSRYRLQEWFKFLPCGSNTPTGIRTKDTVDDVCLTTEILNGRFKNDHKGMVVLKNVSLEEYNILLSSYGLMHNFDLYKHHLASLPDSGQSSGVVLSCRKCKLNNVPVIGWNSSMLVIPYILESPDQVAIARISSCHDPGSVCCKVTQTRWVPINLFSQTGHYLEILAYNEKCSTESFYHLPCNHSIALTGGVISLSWMDLLTEFPPPYFLSMLQDNRLDLKSSSLLFDFLRMNYPLMNYGIDEVRKTTKDSFIMGVFNYIHLNEPILWYTHTKIFPPIAWHTTSLVDDRRTIGVRVLGEVGDFYIGYEPIYITKPLVYQCKNSNDKAFKSPPIWTYVQDGSHNCRTTANVFLFGTKVILPKHWVTPNTMAYRYPFPNQTNTFSDYVMKGSWFSNRSYNCNIDVEPVNLCGCTVLGVKHHICGVCPTKANPWKASITAKQASLVKSFLTDTIGRMYDDGDYKYQVISDLGDNYHDYLVLANSNDAKPFKVRMFAFGGIPNMDEALSKFNQRLINKKVMLLKCGDKYRFSWKI